MRAWHGSLCKNKKKIYNKILSSSKVYPVYLNMANSGLDRIKYTIAGYSTCGYSANKSKMSNTIFPFKVSFLRK